MRKELEAEVVMNFLRGHDLLTEVYDCSNFSLVHFLSLTHPSPVCSEFVQKLIALKFYSFLPKMLNKIKSSTDRGYISIYSF